MEKLYITEWFWILFLEHQYQALNKTFTQRKKIINPTVIQPKEDKETPKWIKINQKGKN